MGNSRLQRNSVQASNVTPSLQAMDVNSHGQPGFDSQSPRPIFFSCKKNHGCIRRCAIGAGTHSLTGRCRGCARAPTSASPAVALTALRSLPTGRTVLTPTASPPVGDNVVRSRRRRGRGGRGAMGIQSMVRTYSWMPSAMKQQGPTLPKP